MSITEVINLEKVIGYRESFGKVCAIVNKDGQIVVQETDIEGD